MTPQPAAITTTHRTGRPCPRAALRAAITAIAIWCSSAAAPLAAQVVPTAGDARAEYFTIVARAADRAARALERAVAAGDSVQLAARFGPDVVWTPSTGAPVRGAGRVAAAFRRARGRVQDFRIELAELDASSRLAYITGRFRYQVPTASGVVTAMAVPFAAALFQEREDDWRIRLLTGGDLPPSLLLLKAPPASAVVGSDVAFDVELRDGAGAPLPRSVIRIDVQAGGGRASPSDLVTDEQGRASTTFTLGGVAGEQAVRVLSGALPDEPLDVRVRAEVSTPTTLALTTDTTRRVTAGQPWPAPIELRVADRFGNPVPGADVQLVVSGAGTLAATRLQTDAEGRARTTLQTAADPGEILVEARIGEVADELALRSRPGLAARVKLPLQGVELLERSNRETGARLLDGNGRPTDDPPLTLKVRDERVALVTDDARVVALAAGQTWLVARAGDVLDSLWVTVRDPAGSAIRSTPRVVRGSADSTVIVEMSVVPPTDSLRIIGLAGAISIDTGAVTLVAAEAAATVPGLTITIAPGRSVVAVTYTAPGTARRPAEGVAGAFPMVRFTLKLREAGRRGMLRTDITRIVSPPKLAPVPLPPPYLLPVLVTPAAR